MIGASVCPLALIKSYHSCGNKSRSFTLGVGGGGVRKMTSKGGFCNDKTCCSNVS